MGGIVHLSDKYFIFWSLVHSKLIITTITFRRSRSLHFSSLLSLNSFGTHPNSTSLACGTRSTSTLNQRNIGGHVVMLNFKVTLIQQKSTTSINNFILLYFFLIFFFLNLILLFIYLLNFSILICLG